MTYSFINNLYNAVLKMNGIYCIHILLFCLFFFVSCNSSTPADIDDDDKTPEDLSMYITDVFEYVYAPGQHAANRNSGERVKFIGKPENDLYLGGFGGYVIAGFDHDIPNIEGEYDFEVFSAGVDSEPAVVYVMCDENGDGIPNETWYELKGSEFEHPETIRDYYVIYYKPVSESDNVTWKDKPGNTGELREGNRKDPATGLFLPTANWWWSETPGDSIVLAGTRLPDAYINNSPDPARENWIVSDDLFTWGYAENNHSKTDYDTKSKSNKFDISNAVDHAGKPVKLQHIRFIKVQTAVFQQAGWLNEISSEVMGARDLHYNK